jgi:hypothetical protein
LKKVPEIADADKKGSGMILELIAMSTGCFMVYGFLFGLGYWIYGDAIRSIFSFGVAMIASWTLWMLWGKLSFK